MNIPQIRLESRFAKLGLETVNASLEIQKQSCPDKQHLAS
jgi:hypothetical protein